MNAFDRIHQWLTNIRTHRGWVVALVAALLAAGVGALVIWIMR